MLDLHAKDTSYTDYLFNTGYTDWSFCMCCWRASSTCDKDLAASDRACKPCTLSLFLLDCKKPFDSLMLLHGFTQEESLGVAQEDKE